MGLLSFVWVNFHKSGKCEYNSDKVLQVSMNAPFSCQSSIVLVQRESHFSDLRDLSEYRMYAERWSKLSNYLICYHLPKPSIKHNLYTLPHVKWVKLKIRMWEIHKYGSVRGGWSFLHIIEWHSTIERVEKQGIQN